MHRFPNDKVYIGITGQKPSRRWREGKGYKRRQPLVFRAIEKYKWENIEHIILYEGLTKEEAEQKEIQLIKKYDSRNPQKGYNSESGGGLNKNISEETKEKIRKANIGKKHTEETKKKIGDKNREAYREGRRKLTREHLLKMQNARKYEKDVWNKGKVIDSGVHVVQMTKRGEFIKEYVNVHQAQKELNIQHVYDACKGKRKSAGGFLWKFKDTSPCG